MHAVILERNKLVSRRVARLFAATGVTTTVIDEPGQLVAAMTGANLVCADAFDGDLVAEQVRATGAHGVLWTAEPLRRALKYLVETPNLNHVLGRKDFE